VPESVAAGERNLRPELVPAVYVERALGQARTDARYARELVPAEVVDPRLRGELAEAGAAAAAACPRRWPGGLSSEPRPRRPRAGET
jgi:hypothetical protein